MNRRTYTAAYRREQRAYYLTGLGVATLGAIVIIITLALGGCAAMKGAADVINIAASVPYTPPKSPCHNVTVDGRQHQICEAP